MATKEEILKKHGHYASYTVKAAMDEYTAQETKELKDKFEKQEHQLIDASREIGTLVFDIHKMEKQLTEANALIEKMHNTLMYINRYDNICTVSQHEIDKSSEIFEKYKSKQTK